MLWDNGPGCLALSWGTCLQVWGTLHEVPTLCLQMHMKMSSVVKQQKLLVAIVIHPCLVIWGATKGKHSLQLHFCPAIKSGMQR